MYVNFNIYVNITYKYFFLSDHDTLKMFHDYKQMQMNFHLFQIIPTGFDYES